MTPKKRYLHNNRFTWDESVSGSSQIKSSAQRGIRAKILELYPSLEAEMDDIWPKKAPMILVKCKDHISLITVDNEILFWNHYDGPYMPTLKLLHKCTSSPWLVISSETFLLTMSILMISKKIE